jgi:hypothetical protein
MSQFNDYYSYFEFRHSRIKYEARPDILTGASWSWPFLAVMFQGSTSNYISGTSFHISSFYLHNNHTYIYDVI